MKNTEYKYNELRERFVNKGKREVVQVVDCEGSLLDGCALHIRYTWEEWTWDIEKSGPALDQVYGTMTNSVTGEKIEQQYTT